MFKNVVLLIAKYVGILLTQDFHFLAAPVWCTVCHGPITPYSFSHTKASSQLPFFSIVACTFIFPYRRPRAWLC